jgi:hypothetical protein
MNLPRPARKRAKRTVAPVLLTLLIASSTRAHASFLAGDALDSVANAISWVVLVVAPIIGIVVFWLVHILPEKIAHKRMHPQTGAIQCLCLLSLAFGGLLWPIAWLWAYTKPVLYKAAYGTDVDETLAHHEKPASAAAEVDQLRLRVAQLEEQIKRGKA